MTVIDKIEQLGAQVARREISQARAVELLIEFTDGGFTPVGAMDVLKDWRGARKRYEDALDPARFKISDGR